jgi:putative oxidoreductase
MNRFTVVARVMLGATFFIFGFDGLVHFLPMPPMPDAARSVIGVLVSYRLFYVVKAIEIGAGLLLLSNRFVPLALCLLAPIIFNIVWFDLHLAPGALPVGVLLAALEGALLWREWPRFRPLFART